jgi:hypothetical protein
MDICAGGFFFSSNALPDPVAGKPPLFPVKWVFARGLNFVRLSSDSSSAGRFRLIFKKKKTIIVDFSLWPEL